MLAWHIRHYSASQMTKFQHQQPSAVSKTARAAAHLGIELKRLHLLLAAESILRILHKALLSGHAGQGKLLRRRSVHLLGEPLLDDVAVAAYAGGKSLGKCRHEPRVMNVVVPFQLEYLI